MRSKIFVTLAFMLFTVLVASSTTVFAQDERWEIGARFHQHWALEGSRVDEIQGYGGFAMFSINKNWSIGGGVDRFYFDLLSPEAFLNIRRADGTETNAFIEVVRPHASVRRWVNISDLSERVRPYLEAGGAIYFADCDSPSGIDDQGKPYEIFIETPTSAAISASGGVNVRVAGGLAINVAVSITKTFYKYHLTDVVSLRTGSVVPLGHYGPSVGVVYRF